MSRLVYIVVCFLILWSVFLVLIVIDGHVFEPVYGCWEMVELLELFSRKKNHDLNLLQSHIFIHTEY
jgi:hypothetical protein